MINSNRGKHFEDRRDKKKKRWNAVKGTRIIEWRWNANWDEIEFQLRERCFSLRAALPRSFFFRINPLCINSYDLWWRGAQCRHRHMSQWIRRIYCIRASGERRWSDGEWWRWWMKSEWWRGAAGACWLEGSGWAQAETQTDGKALFVF